MSPSGSSIDELLDAAQDGMGRVVQRMREMAPKDDGDWEFEQESFGIEDPAKVEAELRAEDDATASETVVDHPTPPGRPTWRELFRANWPDKPFTRRRRRR